MNIFVSYARLDYKLVESLTVCLRELGHDVWSDDRLVGGQKWWDTILDRIRWCDITVVAQSANQQRSKVCRLELEYAEALNRAVLPVRIGRLREDLDSMGAVNAVDWTVSGERRVAKLAAALASMIEPRPLPFPLPEPSALPLLSLDRPNEILNADSLTRSDEQELLHHLRKLVDDPDAGEAVVRLLRRMIGRPSDISAAGVQEAQQMLVQARRAIRGPRGTSTLHDLRMVLGGASRGNLLPILGFGLTDGLIGQRRHLAERLAQQASMARTGQLSDDLPGVAQFLVGFYGEHDMRDLVLSGLRDAIDRSGQRSDSPGSGSDIDGMLKDLWESERHDEEPYSILAQLPCPIFVNAHPSLLLSSALENAGKKPRVEHCRWRADVDDWPESVFESSGGVNDYQPTVDEPLVFQIFGSFEYPETLVLCEDDYLRFVHHVGRREGSAANDAIPSCVKAAAATARLLMVGFSLEDLDARVLMTALIEQEGTAKRRSSSLAVQLDPDGPASSVDQAREYLKRYFADVRRIHMYWGTAEAFAADLAALRVESWGP